MTNPFDHLIVKLATDQRNQKWEGKQVYAYDTRTGVASLYAPSFLKSLVDRGNSTHYYRVSDQKNITCLPIEVQVKDSTRQNHLVEVVVVIKKILLGKMPSFVAALARDGSPPSDVFAAYIVDWIQDFINQKQAAKIDILTRFSPEMEDSAQSRKECVDYCIEKAAKVLGVELACEIRLPEADLMIEPISLQFGVFVNDCEEELKTHIDLNVLPPEDEHLRNLAMQKIISKERIHGAVKMRVGQWFRNHCTLEQFCYKPAEVRLGLEKVLQDYIEGQLYRFLHNFRVTCIAPFEKEFYSREDFEVTCEVEPGPTQILVRHRVLLERQNIAKFRVTGITDLEKWIGKMLNRHTKSVLFEKEYVDLIDDFTTIQNQIRERVGQAVARIGFRVIHLITIPSDEQIRSCLEGVLSFETETLALKTKDSRVEFKLSAVAQVKLQKPLDKIKRFIRPGDYLRDQFKQAVNEEAAQIVRKFPPECLYLYFRDGNGAANTKNVDCRYDLDQAPEAQIKNAIRQRFRNQYGVEVEYLTITEEPTELTELLSAIKPPQNHRVSVTVQPRGDMGTPLLFHFDYRIVAIAAEGWKEFQELAQNCVTKDIPGKAREIHDAIIEMLSRSATGRLEALPLELLCHPNPKVKDKLQRVALDDAIQAVKNHYGVIIELLNFTRDLSQWEESARQKTWESFQSTYSRIKALRQKMYDLEDDLGPHDPDVQEVKDEIARYENELNQFDIGQNRYFKDALTAIAAPDWSKLMLEDQSDRDREKDQPDANTENDEAPVFDIDPSYKMNVFIFRGLQFDP